ncbi:hypothetical protein L195_g042442 [Trifolium pratense]|uniref:Uncharacterized protein n=1 Tax=Trifolium pratense TaxID=57577 RepID=A0A2K3M6F4_TRIPR|nr:hypothetical protein L195_g032997 [Trifolium pratense]PNX86364.1 hypothetical protein L195_g042442 [Trifolium pratense]
MRKAGIKQELSNSMIHSIVPSASTRRSNLINPITNQSNMQFGISRIGFMTDYIFYIPDKGDSTGIAFSVAYKAAMSGYRKELCTYVGSMLCSVVPGFRNSVVGALNGIGVRPHFVSLPSQAEENNIDISCHGQLDWSSILVIFGYYILLLFKVDDCDLFWFDTSGTQNAKRIRELKAKVGCSSPCNSPYGIPFDQHKEKDIRTMLGADHAIRTSVITFLMNNFDHPDSQICSLCQYLSVILSWSGDMRVFTVMNKWLVKTNSRVLSVSRLKEEVDNLEETINAIASHTYPQYFSHVCSVSELFYLDISRFRTLFAVALELEIGGDGSIDYDSAGISQADPSTVRQLVKYHLSKKGVSTVRSMPTIPGI